MEANDDSARARDHPINDHDDDDVAIHRKGKLGGFVTNNGSWIAHAFSGRGLAVWKKCCATRSRLPGEAQKEWSVRFGEGGGTEFEENLLYPPGFFFYYLMIGLLGVQIVFIITV